ncbi:MAG: efflux RND transporter periplasmic adaptor subunit [Persicimonas sp.]
MNPVAQKVAQYGLPLVVLALSVGVVVALVKTKAEPDRKQKAEQRVLVETMRVQTAPQRLDVQASGEVIPAREVTVTPQVAGRIVWVSDSLVPGATVRSGEPLFRIEADNYRIAVREAQTQLAQAQAQLEQEQGRGQVAEREWAVFEDESNEADSVDPSLALRQPQLRSAEVAVDAARARLERAQLDLSRTTVTAPFDAFVRSESADIGQMIGTQSQVASLVGTDRFWVRASVPADKLDHLDIPRVNADAGSEVTIAAASGDNSQLEGRVVRLLGELDPQGRMARVLIEVDDPFGLADDQSPGADEPRGIPLLLNSYVDATIHGATVEDLIEVPRQAIHDGDRVYIFTDEQTLEVRQVSVVWSRPDTVVVDQGLATGERIITSPLPMALEGMKLRAQGQPDATAEEASDE